jgi:hypothetical protein
MHLPKPQRQRSSPHPLGPRPDGSDRMVAAARRANVGAAWEIESHRRRAVAHPVDYIDQLEREVERLYALAYELWAGLPF